MSSEYNYDTDAQFFPFFVLTITSLITVPLTYTLLRAPSDPNAPSTTTAGGLGKKASHITSDYTPEHADIIDTQRAKQKRKELRLKRMLTAASGWLVIAWMAYLMYITERTRPKIWNPYDILSVPLSAGEKAINSRYRRLSITMHPDKRQPNPALNETEQTVNDEWVEIVKAYKALTDEDVRKNYELYGNPDGKQSTSFGIALPQFLVAEGSGKYVLVFYGLLLGIGLPWLVGKWWYGMQKMTRERILVTTAGAMFKEYKERMDAGDVVSAVSAAQEFKDILHGSRAESGLSTVEKKLIAADTVLSEKDAKKLKELDDPTRRKTLALLWAYLSRLDLDDKTLESEKYELAPTAVRMNEAFTSIGLAYGFTAPVLAAYHLQQCLVQAVPPTGAAGKAPLLQLPHFTKEIVQTIEQQSAAAGKKEHLSIQKFMSLPPAQRIALADAAGLAKSDLSVAEGVARQLPYLRVEKAFFKVQGEKFIIPSSLVQFVIKARFIPPGWSEKDVPEVKEEDLKDVDPAEGDLEAQKKEQEQHSVPLAYAPYFSRDRSPRWSVFLADNRQGKIAVPPFTFATFDKPAFQVSEQTGRLEPTFNVVTLKMQFQAPPQPGEYKFVMHMVCDSYLGFDHKQEAVMNIDDASKAQAVDDDDEISEPEEGTIAGEMAALKGQPVADPNAVRKPAGGRNQRLKAKLAAQAEGKGGDDDESDYESGTDEDEGSEESETDTDTDSEDEAAQKKKGWLW